MFYFEKINGKTVLKSDLLNGVEHFFTTRESVIKTKDENWLELVNENRKMFSEYLGINEFDFVNPSQVHSANIEVVQVGKSDYPDCDGLILTNKLQGIFLNFADCTPVIIYDEKQNIGAVSHAGWRGTAEKISALTVEKMVSEFNSVVSDLKAVIGP
ncbi:laccase domain-containing protein, partial [bacterium]|nr:laccase domain-containing protein [bacterium]